METTMRYGARKGTMNFWRRWLAKAASRELSIFPVPGADLLRIYQSEPLHGEARLADSPKEANVLLVIGDVSTELAERAATVYAQMPRPRVLVIAGPEHLDPLPHPDVHVPLEKDFLETALSAARECLSSYSWTEDAEPYRPEKLAKEIEAAAQQQGHMHHHHHGHGGHGHDHGHGGHDHGPGFMSMIAMTKDLPRSPDGLPMEWSDVQFGPFHPGLPGGLSLSMKLDGDTVVKAEAGQGLLGHNLPASVLNNPASLPEYLAAAHPMAPVTYRLLAQKALVNFSSKTPNSTLTLSEAVLLEKERITSHLNWLAVFGTALGSQWMRDQAVKHYHRFQEEAGDASRLSEFIGRIKKMPYLKLKLSTAGKHRVEMEDHNQGHEHKAHDHSGHGHNHGDHAGDEHHHAGHSHEEHKVHEHHEHGGHDGPQEHPAWLDLFAIDGRAAAADRRHGSDRPSHLAHPHRLPTGAY